MRQQTFATGDFERYRKATRREQFLAEMDKVVPWDQLCALIEPRYPKAGNGVKWWSILTGLPPTVASKREVGCYRHEGPSGFSNLAL